MHARNLAALVFMALGVASALQCPPGFIQRNGEKFCDAMEWEEGAVGPQPWTSEVPVRLADGSSWTAGTAFRVWAPHASAVFVVGDFGSARLQPDSTQGYWTVTLGGATFGQKYTYQITYGGRNLTRFDPAARLVSYSGGNWAQSVIHNPAFNWTDGAYKLPPFNQLVIYELHIPTYNPSSQVGTLADVIGKLDYLQLLGVNVVELLPTSEYPGDARGWGYNPGLQFVVESAFGGYNGLKQFVNAAHARGIGVFLDVVWNHLGDPNIYKQFDGWSQAGSGLPSGDTPQGIYVYQNYNADTLWGLRPNYGDANVQLYILQSLRMWIQETHINGFRWDSTICIRKGQQYCWEQADQNPDGVSLLQQATKTCSNLGAVTIAEDLQNDQSVTAPGGLGFNGQWSDTDYYSFHDVLGSPSDSSRNMGEFQNIVSANYPSAGGATWRVLYTENHDKVSGQGNDQGRWPNIVNRANPTSYIAQKLSTLGTATVLLAPGIPMIFEGQEFLDHQDFTFGAVPNLDWSQVGTYTKSGGWQNVGPFKGIFDLTRALIRLRLNSDGVSAGLLSPNVAVTYNSPADKVICYQRGNVIVVQNLSGSSWANYCIGLPATGAWQVRLNSDLKIYSSAFGDMGKGVTAVQASSPGIWGQPAQGCIPLGAYTTFVLSQ